jgi:CHASE2 domain-containing sensor protein
MSKWVILELEGDLSLAGFRATLEIRADGELQALKVKGSLPPAPEMAAQLHHHWHQIYRPLGLPLRIKGQKIIHKGSINQRLAECQRSAQHLREQLRDWLRAESFQQIDCRLREELNRHEIIRFLIRSSDLDIQKLPWHEWDFFERYPNAEVALSTFEYESVWVQPQAAGRHPVRILAILGNSQGINIEADRRVLAQLPQAQVTFLVEPNRQQLNDHLWEAPWDILFFAGHSITQERQGRIYINQTDSLTLSELHYGLRKAITQGLQLAIFNACDGLGLVQELQQLHIPQMVVMREPVADQVAAAFLTYFLKAFAVGEPFYLAVRHARERLQGLEYRFPCASWLPVIYQNPLVLPPDWYMLQGRSGHPSRLSRSALPSLTTAQGRSPAKKRSLSALRVGWISLLVAIALLIVRHLGVLQPFELAAYDHVMRSRPAEAIDSRIVVVEVLSNDLSDLGGYPLSDQALAQTVDTLQALEPAAIALDMHRYQPRGAGREALIDQFRQYPNLFIACAYGQADPDYGSPPEFSDDQLIAQVGFSNLVLDQPTFALPQQPGMATIEAPQEGIVRRHLLSYEPDLVIAQSIRSTSSCSTPYSLSLQLAYRFLDRAGVEPLAVNDDDHWQLGRHVLSPLPRRFGGYQNLDGLSAQLMLNYRGLVPSQRVSLQQVLTGQVDADKMRDRLVLVGYTAPVARDSVDTPYGKMAGVWLHAHMVSQLLSAVLDDRPLIKALPQWHGVQWGAGLWIFAWSLLGGAIGSGLNQGGTQRQRRRWLMGGGVALVGLSWGLFSLGVVAITQGIWLPLIPAILSVLVTGGCVVLTRDFPDSPLNENMRS